jgi:hypothetical protein
MALIVMYTVTTLHFFAGLMVSTKQDRLVLQAILQLDNLKLCNHCKLTLPAGYMHRQLSTGFRH